MSAALHSVTSNSLRQLPRDCVSGPPLESGDEVLTGGGLTGDGATFVQRSSTAGAGLFAAIDLNRGVLLHKYAGAQVAANVMRCTNYARGYVMRIGPRYMDARDPAGLEKVDVRSPVFAPRPRCLPGL